MSKRRQTMTKNRTKIRKIQKKEAKQKEEKPKRQETCLRRTPPLRQID